MNRKNFFIFLTLLVSTSSSAHQNCSGDEAVLAYQIKCTESSRRTNHVVLIFPVEILYKRLEINLLTEPQLEMR